MCACNICVLWQHYATYVHAHTHECASMRIVTYVYTLCTYIYAQARTYVLLLCLHFHATLHQHKHKVHSTSAATSKQNEKMRESNFYICCSSLFFSFKPGNLGCRADLPWSDFSLGLDWMQFCVCVCVCLCVCASAWECV